MSAFVPTPIITGGSEYMAFNAVSGARTPDGVVGPLLVEKTAPEHLIAQRGPFTGPSAVVAEELYATVKRGIARRSRFELMLQPECMVSTNTYFGRFPACYWQRWTSAPEVTVRAQTSGSGRIAVIASDMDGQRRTVVAAGVADDAPLELTAPIDRFVDGGALWLEMSTGPETLAVRDLQWQVTPRRTVRPAALVICTHNRPRDCTNILLALAADHDAVAGIDAVYVVDQGTDRVDAGERFEEVAAALGEKLVYVTQPNLGGAGGFTRGLYEVAGVAGADHANVIMDDDVICEPDVLIRLNAFANLTVEPVIVGAQYGLAFTRIKGIEDFLLGPQILRDGGIEALAAIRSARAEFGDTLRHPASAAAGLRASEVEIVAAPPEPSRTGLILAKRMLDQLRNRSGKAPAGIAARDSYWWHVSRFDTAVVTDASQQDVHVRRQDPTVRRELLARCAKACYRLFREGPDVGERYRDAMPELTGRENWARLFGKS